MSSNVTLRVGQGYDVHRLEANCPLILGGVKIDFPKGLYGHSDGDVLIHAIIDALFGAAAQGDIGQHYPDTDDVYKGSDSRFLLRMAVEKISELGYEIVNVDTTVITEAPKLKNYILQMRKNLASDLNLSWDNINIKAKTNEKLGYLGRNEAIEAQAIVLLHKKN